MTIQQFSVTVRGGVYLITGGITTAQICGFSSMLDDDAIFSTRLAEITGANLVIGTGDDIEALIKELEPDYVKGVVSQHSAKEALTPNMVKWLASGRRGVSSNTMFSVMTGVAAMNDWGYSHPHDPDDLSRCRRLLEQVPEFQSQLWKLKPVSKQWSALVDHWDELCRIMDEEAPDWRSGKGLALKTFELMVSLLKDC